ncbi:MAG: carboxypeptidase-like regulatory domain-containing protein, partial [Bacteroidetes bacterium]|nr:carboxypeptidase-like regulatory domain-containing protein [Bacteroidota bacterium]
MKNFILALSAWLLPFLAAAQLSVSGKVTDQQTGAALPGATISFNATSSTVSDAKGNYQIHDLTSGPYQLKVTYVGYQPVYKNVTLRADSIVNFALTPSSIMSEEVTVSATRASKNSPIAFTNL